MENKPEQTSKKNSNVIYFLIVVVVALLGTDVYLYLQKKKDVAKIIYQADDEKHRLQTELDSLEAQIEQVNTSKAKLSSEMQARTDSLQNKIQVLKRALAKGQLTVAELKHAQEDIKQLRYFVTKYTADIEELRQQNASLTTERDTLKNQVASASQKATTLEQQNQELNTKVKVASALKMGAADIVAYKIKGNGKETDVTRAGSAKKIKVNFNIVSNPVAEKGVHDIYMRIIDPAGNLMVTTDSGVFTGDDQELQYTYKTAIEFKDDGTMYTIDWINPAEKFVKGVYTVILYADGYTMGKTEFKLK